MSVINGIVVVSGADTPDNDAGVVELLGSLSGRYFCDNNGDGLDNDGDVGAGGGSPGVAGITVALLDANGDEVLDGNGDRITTVTDANGDYSFANLSAGVYGVRFAQGVVDKVLTTQDVNDNDNDDIDSDAMGDVLGFASITNIAVLPGQNTPDNDIGVFPNQPPDVLDDAGVGCADELIFVDFSDNFSDPDAVFGGSPSITMINGQEISQDTPINVSILTGDGLKDVKVTLTADDQFIFDGEDAFAFLDIGEKETESFTVTVTDSIGASSQANIEVTFKGDANSYASLASTFPSNGDYQVVSGTETSPPGNFAFSVRIDNTGDERFDGMVFENAYCLSATDAVLAGADFATAPENMGDILSSEGSPAANIFDPMKKSFFNNNFAADNLDLINYIVAQDYESNGIEGFDVDGWDVQWAIWELTDGFNSDNFIPGGLFSGLDEASVDAILLDAATNGEGFSFDDPGNDSGIVGAIIDPNPATDENSQPFIIGLRAEDYDCIC